MTNTIKFKNKSTIKSQKSRQNFYLLHRVKHLLRDDEGIIDAVIVALFDVVVVVEIVSSFFILEREKKTKKKECYYDDSSFVGGSTSGQK